MPSNRYGCGFPPGTDPHLEVHVLASDSVAQLGPLRSHAGGLPSSSGSCPGDSFDPAKRLRTLEQRGPGFS